MLLELHFDGKKLETHVTAAQTSEEELVGTAIREAMDLLICEFC